MVFPIIKYYVCAHSSLTAAQVNSTTPADALECAS